MDMPELWTAILSEHYDLANQMISRGANVNQPIKTNIDPVTTLLHYAVMQSNVRCIRALVNLGANFNARDSGNRTPLHWAAIFDAALDVVDLFINEGADVDARDNNQLTPLHIAARENSIELAKTFITRGASINAINENGWSIMHFAILGRSSKMVKMLISHGVTTDPKDFEGRTPLLVYLSIKEKHDTTKIINLLLDNGADVNSKSHKTDFPLVIAAKNKCSDSVCLLLKRGARVNEATDMGITALHVACKKGLVIVTSFLLKFGADLNACDWEGTTPFEQLNKNPSSPSRISIARLIIRETIKREALGQSLCEGYKQMVQSREFYLRFEKKCREELKQMQSKKIDIEDSAISFFDILTIDQEKLTALARNENIVTAFESSGYAESLRIYAGYLTMNFDLAKRRANLSTSAVQKIAAYVKYGYLNENHL